MAAAKLGKALPALDSCIHSVVYAMDVQTGKITNLNKDLLNLDDFADYTISQYLEDRASEGITVVSVADSLYRFDDGLSEILYQQIERFSPELLLLPA